MMVRSLCDSYASRSLISKTSIEKRTNARYLGQGMILRLVEVTLDHVIDKLVSVSAYHLISRLSYPHEPSCFYAIFAAIISISPAIWLFSMGLVSILCFFGDRPHGDDCNVKKDSTLQI